MTHSGHDGEEASGIEQPWPGACPQSGGQVHRVAGDTRPKVKVKAPEQSEKKLLLAVSEDQWLGSSAWPRSVQNLEGGLFRRLHSYIANTLANTYAD